MNKMIGIGRVVEGRIVYTGANGGFVAPVTKKQIAIEDVASVAVQEEIDIPQFMKNYKERREVKPFKKEGKVIQGNFPKRDDEEGYSNEGYEPLERAIEGFKKFVRPVTDFFDGK